MITVSAVVKIEEVAKEMRETAEAARREEQYVCIDNPRRPWVQVFQGENEVCFFQGYEAQQLLDEVPAWVSAEDYLLWAGQGKL